MTTLQEKSLPLAIGLNLVLPGAGYMYMGKMIAGVAALVVVSLIFLWPHLVFVPELQGGGEKGTWLGLNAIMAIDMWMLSKKNKAAVSAADTRKCPFCAELIKKEAKVCKHCHRDVQ